MKLDILIALLVLLSHDTTLYMNLNTVSNVKDFQYDHIIPPKRTESKKKTD